MSNHFFNGFQSQCAVSQKFLKQGIRLDQYCSNVALNLNAKLANAANRACAWKTSFAMNGALGTLHEGITWINEAPTMVIGVVCSSGPGQDYVSVVYGSAALDANCTHIVQEMKIHNKNELFGRSILRDIIKALAVQFYQYN